MTSVEKRHSGHRKHRKHSDGAHSDTSSGGGSFLDETDREVSSLTDRAFRSLCIGDEAVYNDSDLGGGAEAFGQSGHGWDTEALKRAAHERLSLRVQQYGEEPTQGAPYGAQTLQGDPRWEGNGERTERGVSATFQRSFVDMSRQEEPQGDEQLALLNGPMELGSQNRRSRSRQSRVSSLVKAFSSDGYRDTNLREWSTNEASWDKSALMSIQRELYEFSDACHQNFNSGPFSPPGPFSSRDNNFYSSEMATAVAHMDSTSSFARTSHSAHSAFNNANSSFFIHSEFSPFKLWRDHNRFPFQQGEVTGFMPRSEFPRWYETPMYKELSLGAQPPGPGTYTERGARPQRKPVAPPPPPRSTSTSSVLQKASALEKRSESELAGQYPPWKQTQGGQAANRLPSQRPSTVSPTGDLSRHVRDTLSSVSRLQQKITMMTSEQSSVAVEMAAKQQGLFNSYDNLIPFSNASAVTVEQNVAGNTASSTTPFNISQLLTPVIPPAYQDTETLDAMPPPGVEHPAVRAESRGATPDVRSSYKSRGASLLFNLKDNRKRVKSTYSPPKFKGPERADRSKQQISQNANEPRDTIIDMPDFPDPYVQIPQVFVQEESGMTDAALHQALQEQCSRVQPPAAYTSLPYSGLNAEYNAREYLVAQMKGDMVPHGGVSGFPQGNCNSNQLNGLNRQEDLSPFSPFKMGQIDKREPRAGDVYGQASSERLGVYNTLPIATSPLTKHNISPKPFYSTTDTARSNIDSNSQNRGYLIAKTSTEQNASKSIPVFTNVDGYEQVKENRYGYNAVSYQDSSRQQAYGSTASGQSAEKLGVEDKPRPAWKGEIAAYMSEKDKQAQSSQSAQEQSWNDGTSYHPHKATFHAPYQPLASNNISNQLKQYANEPVPKDQSEPYSNQDPGTAKAKYEPHRAEQNEVHETKDNYPTQNYYPYGKMEQEYRKQQMFYSEDTKNTVLQETAQTKRHVPKLEENEAPRLQQNDFKQQGNERDKQRQLPSSAEGKQRSEIVLTNQITAENPKAEQIQVDHVETEPPKTPQAEGTGGVQVGQPSAGLSGAELIIEAQPGGERHKAEDMKAERAMGGPAQQVKAQDYNLEHVAEKQAEEGASEGQTEHVKDKLGKAAPDETENNKQEQAEADNGAIQQQTQQSGVKQVEDRQSDREWRVAENSYEVKEIKKSEAEQVEISQVTVEQAKVEQKKEELRGKIKTEHVEQAKEDTTRGELIEAGELTTNTEQTQTEQAKAQLARAEQAKAELSKIEKMKSESAKSKAKQADTEQVKLESSKVELAKTELAKARAELAKIKEKMRGEQKGQVGSVSIEEGNVVNKSNPEKLEAAENLKYQHNEDVIVNRSDPVKADRGGDDYEHIREKYGLNNTDESQKTPLVDEKVVEAMNNKESKDETNPERIPIDKIGQEHSLSSTEYGEVRENQYVYSESSKEFKLSSANDLLTDGNRRSNNDTFNDKAKDDQATNDNSEKREHPPDHNISLSRKPDSAKPLERKPKDTHSTPYKALSYKERAQARQEILTSKIKAHAEKEISAIKEKGLSKNPPKHLVSGQGSHVRQKPPPLETAKAHDSTDSNNIAPKQQTGASETRTVPLKSEDTVVMREEGCILETQTTNKSECESEAIPEDSAPSLKLVLGQSEITTAGDDLQIMGIRVTVRERKPSVSDGQVDEDAHEAAKSKISPETQPLLFKQEIITRKAMDYTNKNPSESPAKSYVQDAKESQQLTIERTSVNEDEAKSDVTSSKCEQMDLDGTSLPVETRQDSAPSEETLHDENNSMLFISMGKQDTRTHSGEKSQGDEELHIDGIAIQVVPRVIEEVRQEITENHPAIKIPPSSVGAVNENKPATLPSPGTKTNTSKDEDRAKIFTPELKPIKDRLEARHTSPSERQGTHSLRFGDEHNAEENKQVKSGTSEKPMTVEATTHARMDEDYFQFQGATETNQREAHLSSNVGNMSNAVSQRNEEPGAKGSGEIASLHPENKRRAYTPTQRQSKFSARTKTDEDVHARKHDTESQPYSSATESQPANSIHSTRDDRMQENVNYKQKATPDISAIADYARLKVIAAEGSPDTKQDFHPGKKEGFFPLIQTRPSRRPVFTSESPLSAKENALPKEPEVSAKVSKEPKAVVFSTMEQEHKRTGMFRLGDKENTQGGQSIQQSHSHPMPASTSASHPLPTQGQTHNFGSSGGAQRDETRIKQKEEERAAKAEERRREALRQERLAAQREEEMKEAKQREAVRKAEEERRAKQREEDLRMKRMMEEKKAAEVEEARKAAQREEERRAKERQAITARLEEERRAKQREMERKAEEERKAKQKEMERKAEEERKAKQREMERKAEEERKQKQKEMERKAEEERRAKQREMERKAEEERKAKQKEMERKAEEERKAKQKEMERKAEEERKAKQKEMERKAEEKKAKQREMERKAEEEKKAKQREMERKAEEERKSKQKEMERKAEEERKAKQKEMERKAEEERKAKQREMERKAEEERKAKQREMERKAEEERKAKQREMERRAAEIEEQRIEEERRAKQKEMERKAEEERKAKQKEMERKAEEERKAKQREMERRAAEIEEQRIEEERRAKEREAMAVQREQERRAKQRELERREEEERRAKQREQERREEEERRAKQAVEEMRRKQIEDERRVAQREEERRAKEREAVAAKLEEERRERQRQAERRAEEEKKRAKEIEEQKRAKQREEEEEEEEEERRAAQLGEERRIKRMEEERIAALMEEERKERQRQEERRAAQLAEERRIKQMEEERRERQRKEEMIIAQREEEERRAAQLAEERRIKQMEEMIIAQREEEERRRRAAQIEEEERRAAQLAEERRIKLMEEERRAAQIEEERKERQRKAQREEEERRRAAQQEEEERSRAYQLEEDRKERQRMAARKEEGERRRTSQLEDDRKERQRKEERMVAQIQEERRRCAKMEEEESNAKESEERRAKEAEEELRATQEKERRAEQREERRDKRHAAQRTDTLQYYDINTAEGHHRPPRSPLPSRRRAEPPGVEPADDAGSYGRPHATPSPAPSASRSNASSPALGAKPTMFKVKDNTSRGASFTRSVKPRFHKNIGEDFRVGSPLDGWRGSQVAEDEQDKARRSAGTPVQHDGFTGSSRFSHARETSLTQDHPAPLLEHRPYARRSIALDEDDSRSILSNMSEDMESFATSAADLAELRGIYDYDRPESACSFSSDVARALGKPPSVPAKSEKALRRAKRLTQRRIKKESSKTDVESPAPEEKPLYTNPGVPSSFTELHSSSDDFPVQSSPHFSAPISLAHAPTQDSSPPSSHARERSRSFHASPHQSPPISLPLASPHHSPPVSLPAAPQKFPSVPRSPTLSRRPAPVTQYQVEPGYSQNFPVTQRKVLQDPGSGQYFVVDMPVQVKAKTFFDPETGKYVQLNVRQTAQGGSPPQPRARQQAQPQQPARPQAAPTGKPHALSQDYPGYPQHHPSSLPTHRSSSGMSAASTLPEDSYPARQSQIDGHREIERGQDSHEHNNCSPEQTRYMDTACEPGKTRTTAYNTHNTEQAARSHQPQTNNTAGPPNIITMSELEDFMDDW